MVTSCTVRCRVCNLSLLLLFKICRPRRRKLSRCRGILHWRWGTCMHGRIRICRQWASFDIFRLPGCRHGGAGRTASFCLNFLGSMTPSLDHGHIFWACVIVGHLDSNLSGILPTALQRMPVVTLASTWDNQVLEIYPCLSNQVGLLIVVEYGYLESKVVR